LARRAPNIREFRAGARLAARSHVHTASPFEFQRASNPFASPVTTGVSVFATPAPSGSVDVAFDAVPDAAPSARDLLARAARLGPARPTLESISMPTDPVLGQKQQPAIAARRMRFTRIVKATLGACVALCVAALAATAMSGEASAASRAFTRTAAAPSRRVSSVEPLGGDVRAKATRPTAAAARGPKALTRTKRR
jgi:hypothetical protein